MNIRFNYEYRDAGNYHQQGSIVFSNPTGIQNTDKLSEELRKHLFDSEFFYPDQLAIPDLHFEKWNQQLDHDWFCFLGLELTTDKPTDHQTITSFLAEFKVKAKL